MVLPILATILAFQGKLEKTDVVVGKGIEAKTGDYVTVEYTGKLTNGKQFDSSVGRAPFSFVLDGGQVIKGWDLGVAGMKVGGKRKLKIPASLGYGAAGAGADIPGGATLLFDVELKKIDRVEVKVTKKGSGPAVKGRDSVEVLYVGKLKDGKEFDSSAKHGNRPIPFQIGAPGLIPGFACGTLGMKLGEKRTITIPYAIAYGEAGMPPVIPAKSDLIFELELVSLNGVKK
jgi:peptidylprolyl isomerase